MLPAETTKFDWDECIRICVGVLRLPYKHYMDLTISEINVMISDHSHRCQREEKLMIQSAWYQAMFSRCEPLPKLQDLFGSKNESKEEADQADLMELVLICDKKGLKPPKEVK